MTRKQRPTDESVATVILGSTSPSISSGGHLDENDLVLLEAGSPCDAELAVIRRHLETCDACRQLVSEVLRDSDADTGLDQSEAARQIEEVRTH